MRNTITVDLGRSENELFSLIIGKSGIVYSDNHHFDNNEMLKIKLLKSMTPVSHLIVYYIEPTGEIIYDRMKLEFESTMTNKV